MQDATVREAQPERSRTLVVAALGVAQILGWGTSFYFPAVFGAPIVAETGWSLTWVVGGTSIGLLTAGLISPRVGRLIDRRGGRMVVASSSLLFAAGLAIIGLAPTLPVYLAGWVVLGMAMGTGLYDAVFAALGRLYGHSARGPITNLTLIGGFASTVCWPLSAFLIETIGWRYACFTYAALHLAVALPLQLVMPERAVAPREQGPSQSPATTADDVPIHHERLAFVLIAGVMTIAAGIGAIVVVHLLAFLQGRGMDFAAAVAVGTLFGPAQVAARVFERLAGSYYHPIWTMIGACGFMALGLVLLVSGLPLLTLAMVIYAGGYGVSWIARGTLPLALFGPARYPVLMGKLAFPSLIVQALAPSAGALLMESRGVDATIATLAVFAILNVALVVALLLLSRPSRTDQA